MADRGRNSLISLQKPKIQKRKSQIKIAGPQHRYTALDLNLTASREYGVAVVAERNGMGTGKGRTRTRLHASCADARGGWLMAPTAYSIFIT